jgi:hypothetical protein
MQLRAALWEAEEKILRTPDATSKAKTRPVMQDRGIAWGDDRADR